MAYLLYSLLFCERSSSGRAPPCQGGGSEFEPRRSLQKKKRDSQKAVSLFFGIRPVLSNSLPPPKTRAARFFQSEGTRGPCKGPQALCGVGGSEFGPRRPFSVQISSGGGRRLSPNSVPPPLKRALRVFSNPRAPGAPAKGQRPFVGWAEASSGLVAVSVPHQQRGRTPPFPELSTSTSKRAERVFSIRGRPGSLQRAAGSLWGGRKRVRASSPVLCPTSSGGGRRFPRTRYLH